MLPLRVTEADIDEFILKNHSDVYRIMQHMAESMYGLKYGMDMYIKDLEDSKNNTYLKGFSRYFSKQFAKYNATNMKDPMKESKGKINYKV